LAFAAAMLQANTEYLDNNQGKRFPRLQFKEDCEINLAHYGAVLALYEAQQWACGGSEFRLDETF